MTQKEITRLRVINQTIDKVITLREAAEIISDFRGWKLDMPDVEHILEVIKITTLYDFFLGFPYNSYYKESWLQCNMEWGFKFRAEFWEGRSDKFIF